MIKGCKYWYERKTFSIQTNNGVEAILRNWSKRTSGYLETCGPTAAINILDAMGVPTGVHSPALASIQPEDFLTIWMNDPKNHPGLGIPTDTMVNEWAQAYPNAIKTVFGVPCRFLERQSFEWVSAMVSSGVGVMLCLKDPGHYVAAVAFDSVAAELIYRDPWPGRTKTDGYNIQMGGKEFDENTKPLCVVFGK